MADDGYVVVQGTGAALIEDDHKEWAPYSTRNIVNGREQYGGTFGAMLEAMATSMRLRYQLRHPPDDVMGERLPNGTHTGLVGMLQRDEVDMIFLSSCYTYDRSHFINFGSALLETPVSILSGAAQIEDGSNVFGYILTFDWKVWALVMCTIPVLAVTLAICTTGLKNLAASSQKHAWDLLCSLLYEQIPRKHKTVSSRLVLAAWFLGVLVIANSFAGLLKSCVAVKKAPAQVDSVDDVIRDPPDQILTWGGSRFETVIKNSPERRHRELYFMILKTNGSVLSTELFRESNLQKVEQRRAIIVVDKVSIQCALADHCRKKHRGSFHIAREDISTERLAFLYSKKLPRRMYEAIDTRARWLFEGGLVSKWMADSTGNWQRCMGRNEAPRVQSFTLDDSKAVFVLWAIILAMAFLAFCVEVCTYRASERHPATGALQKVIILPGTFRTHVL
ncbi:glutamate receptor ionotropic, kainate 5-like isoform X2 [Ornithodoros turicata]|uniref:glutamate receptor ionotropic, kainate 5-like isoform X2 n=1 Tax=Ornithodoros turicata TaxID=34597 RepID=UPI003138A78D